MTVMTPTEQNSATTAYMKTQNSTNAFATKTNSLDHDGKESEINPGSLDMGIKSSVVVRAIATKMALNLTPQRTTDPHVLIIQKTISLHDPTSSYKVL